MNKTVARLKNQWQEIRRGNFIKLMTQYSDLMVPISFMLIVATVIIPVPPSILSFLIIINMLISLSVLMVSFFIKNPLQLTSYPSILLMTALFRLFISISVTRSILMTGYAGDVISAMGHVTGGGNIIVGMVMFIVILVMQFLVVAKGSERVAEVAARFTLDAMPGKQMSIDADMRAGLIPQAEARRLRSALQKESQLYGAMDGAMKYVKGDSIATIIIVVVNIVGGLAMGVLMKGLSFGQAVNKYTILTIGDGLAAIIPSILIAFSAGIVVTRVASDEEGASVGSDITQQLLFNPKPLWIASGLLLTLMLIPGMPKIQPLVVGAAAAGLAYSLYRMQKAAAMEEAERKSKAGQATGPEDLQPTFIVPIIVMVSHELTPLIDPNTETGARFRADLPKLRTSIYYDIGVMLPTVHVSGNSPLKPNQYMIAIKEIPVAFGSIKPGCVYVNDSAENIKVFGLDGEDLRNPADLRPGAWIPAAQRQIAELAGLKVWGPADVLMLHLSHVLKRHAHEFVGIQEAQAYLDFVARAAPKLVEEVVPKIITIHQFADVLQRLVQEGVSIRDTKTILDALSEWGRIEKGPVMLTEYIRSAMKRALSYKHTKGRDTLFVYLLDPEIEDVIRGAIRRTSTGSFLSLDPAIAHDILDALRRELANVSPTAQKPVIITDMELRRFVRKMVELEFPNLSVLSYQELAPDLNVQPVARISMRPAQTNRLAPPADAANAMSAGELAGKT